MVMLYGGTVCDGDVIWLHCDDDAIGGTVMVMLWWHCDSDAIIMVAL